MYFVFSNGSTFCVKWHDKIRLTRDTDGLSHRLQKMFLDDPLGLTDCSQLIKDNQKQLIFPKSPF